MRSNTFGDTEPLGTNDRILFADGTITPQNPTGINLFASGPQTLRLSAGVLEINRPVEIAGPGSSQLTIDAMGANLAPGAGRRL